MASGDRLAELDKLYDEAKYDELVKKLRPANNDYSNMDLDSLWRFARGLRFLGNYCTFVTILQYLLRAKRTRLRDLPGSKKDWKLRSSLLKSSLTKRLLMSFVRFLANNPISGMGSSSITTALKVERKKELSRHTLYGNILTYYIYCLSTFNLESLQGRQQGFHYTSCYRNMVVMSFKILM